jgi:hypothetical protein
LRWKAYIRGPDSYLRMFPTAFSSPELAVVVEQPQTLFFTSNLLDTIDDLDMARSKATELTETLNGLAALVWPGFHPKCELLTMSGVAPDGTEINALCAVPRIAVLVGGDTEGVHDLILDQPGRPFPGVLRTAVSARLSDPFVQDALRVFGSEEAPNWMSLYKVVELIEWALENSDSMVVRGWISRTTLDRFNASANNWLASGLYARHAKDWAPPPRPLSIFEARTVVRQLLARWLAHAGSAT